MRLQTGCRLLDFNITLSIFLTLWGNQSRSMRWSFFIPTCSGARLLLRKRTLRQAIYLTLSVLRHGGKTRTFISINITP